MNNGAFGENYPYTNFHDLNMDWILKIIKDFEDHYTTINTSIDNGVENINNTTQEGITSIENKTEEGVNEVNGTYEEAIARLLHVVSNMTRRIILIGDSYFNRLNPSNKKIPEIVQPIIEYSDDNYYYTNIAGGAFAHIEPDHKFIYLLQQLYPSIENPDTITDIYVCCGANDTNYDYQTNRDAVRSFASWCKNNLPKAVVTIVPWGITFNSTNLFYKETRVMQAFRSCAEFSVRTIENAKYLLYNTFFMESDRCHPNSLYGVNTLAFALANIIQTGSCETHFQYNITDLNPTLTMDNLTDPLVVHSYVLTQARIARDNGDIMLTQVNNYAFANIVFNMNGASFDISNYIHITMDDCIACGRIYVTGSENSPSFLVTLSDSQKPENRTIAIGCLKYNSTSNKYEILIRPQGPFTLDSNSNVINVYLNTQYTD